MREINLAKCLSQALFQLVIFDMKMLTMRAKKEKTGRCVSKLLEILWPCPILPFWIGDHPHMVWRLCFIGRLSWLPFRITFPLISLHVLLRHRTRRRSERAIEPGNFSTVPAVVVLSSIFLHSSRRFLFDLHSRCVQPKKTQSRRCVGSSRSSFFINLSRKGSRLFPSWHFDFVHVFRLEQSFRQWQWAVELVPAVISVHSVVCNSWIFSVW